MWLELHAKLSSHPVGDPIKPNLKRTREVHALPCCAWSQQVNNGHWSLGLSVCLGLGGRDLRFLFITSLDFILQAINSVACSCENSNLKAIISDIFENLLPYLFIYIYTFIYIYISFFKTPVVHSVSISPCLVFWEAFHIIYFYLTHLPLLSVPLPSLPLTLPSLYMLKQLKPSEQRGFTPNIQKHQSCACFLCIQHKPFQFVHSTWGVLILYLLPPFSD